MKTIMLDYTKAHDFVSSSSHRGYYWDGWDIVRWVPNSSGYTSKNGVFKNGQWGMSYRYPVSNDGTWKIKVPANVEYN
jgi:hypothetical protein